MHAEERAHMNIYLDGLHILILHIILVYSYMCGYNTKQPVKTREKER